ncbi:MAG: polysaccharide lyase family 7 protein [Candidatus Moranbacteria bacterium]|nr:polysaccharide lyase family 7 protein [Candidatus Moranbacteria bacterium]
MQDKFSYYDFIANIIPATFLWWGLTLLPFVDSSRIINAQSEMERLAILVVVVYVLGLAIQFLSKNIIEWFMKRIFWRGRFYSEICWIELYGKIQGGSRSSLLRNIGKIFGYTEEELSVLDVNIDEPEEIKAATELSQDIYFKADAYTQANGLAIKAHTQSSFYSLFRGLSFVCLVLMIVFGITFFARPEFQEIHNISLFVAFFFLFIFFILRAKERLERYIEGIFYSLL